MDSSSFGEDGPEDPNVPGGDDPDLPGGDDPDLPGDGSSDGSGDDGSEDAPYTGDNSQQQMMIWGAAMGVSLIGIVILAVILRKRMADSRN